MEYKASKSEIKSVDPNGTVIFYASVFNNRDLGNDIIMPGAYSKTIKENLKNIRHFKSHDSSVMPGVIQELMEDNYGLLVKSKLILNTQIGRETYEEYKAMAEAGKSMDHSVGYTAIKWEKRKMDGDNEDEERILRELKLYEVSTLTAWGMNPLAQTVAVKSLENLDLDTLFTEEKYFKMLLNCRFTDAKLEQVEALKNHVSSLIEYKAEQITLNSKPRIVEGIELINELKFF